MGNDIGEAYRPISYCPKPFLIFSPVYLDEYTFTHIK